MISIVIPYQPSKNGNTELRYALQGIRKHLRNVGEIFVIGSNPNIGGVTWIPADPCENFAYKEANIFQKLLVAARLDDVSDPFLYMQDDQFLLSAYDAETFPTYYSTAPLKGYGQYNDTIENTKKIFEQHGLRFFKNYDIHCPIRMRKERIIEMADLDWKTKWGFLIKNLYVLYGSWFELHEMHMLDLKIVQFDLTEDQIRDLIKGRDWFSTGDTIFAQEPIRNVLNSLYE